MQTIQVPAGADIRAAILAANSGDTLVLEAGATYPALSLPNKLGTVDMTIQSSRVAELPVGRVGPAHSPLMAKIVSPGSNEPAIKTEPGAHNYKLDGIEVAPINEAAVVSDLVKLGDGSSEQNTVTGIAHHLVIDRSYIHGHPTQEVKRGIALNSGEASILNSYISDIHGIGYDTQAICGWNGPGPYHIINNYLEAAGENVMFGGSDPAIPNLVPSDIEIRRNHFFKPLAWKVGHPTYAGKHWTVKNLLELKNARRVVIDGNTFENNWTDGQAGWAILLKSQNQDGNCPWCVSEDIVFSNNIVKGSENGLNVSAYGSTHPSVQMKRLQVVNNLWDVENVWYQGTDGAREITLENNTHLQWTGNVMTLYGRPTTQFTVRNNLGARTGYGIKGDGLAEGNPTLSVLAPGAVVAGNVLAGADATTYPAGSFYPATMAVVQLGADHRLSPTSPFKGKATDGKDPGADMDAIAAAMGGTTTPTPIPSVVIEFTDVVIPPANQIDTLFAQMGNDGFHQAFSVVQSSRFYFGRVKGTSLKFDWVTRDWLNGLAARLQLANDLGAQGYGNIFVWSGKVRASRERR